MKPHGILAVFGITLAIAARAEEGLLDQVGEMLAWSTCEDQLRARLSGTLDLEGYHLPQPSPGLLYTTGREFFNPRLTVFLDSQWGPNAYFFAQARVDRGFDPSDDSIRARLDEYALRVTLGRSGHLQLQVGKFATVVGSWVARHGSWQNSFVTAPVAYENLTGIWDTAAARSSGQLLAWAHVNTVPASGNETAEKVLRTPVIWGPSYASGLALFGAAGRMDFALEVKNTSLSSHPQTWDIADAQWQHPTFSSRIGYRPNPAWNLGVSGSTGSYLAPGASPTLAAGHDLGDYRQVVVGADLGFAWHHWQLWAEVFSARFEIPLVANVDTFVYYVEARYKFTPQLSGALRWNQQSFGDILQAAGTRTAWGRDISRIDAASTFRFTAHTHLKLQYSLQHEPARGRETTHILAAQFTVRF